MSSHPGDLRAGPVELRIAPVGFRDDDAQALVAQVQAEYVELYGGPDDTPMDDSVFDPPAGAFFLGYLADVPVAMGGWRFRPDVERLGGRRTAEIKRMYVAPGGRRRGLARRMLEHLERTARGSGADVMVLETGTAQPEAIALYESAGYELVEKFGHYSWSPKSRCYGKRLASER
ncbi:GNAT family N-acetyltransferase [Nocardioides mesophilus]|uniref:GNAT family N-acetyltransferase n=1 Tax=Nocardioides mesophilus TaxID=433659 RepID=UPI001FE50A67|nr:GNAT family N-acetyltransferase [Nocardioides mesophilus]